MKKLSYEILLFLSICLLWSWRVSNSPYEKVNSAISDIWKLQNGTFVYEDISHRSGDGEQELLWGSRQEGRFQLAADGEWDWYYTGTSNTQEPVWASWINGIYLDNLSDMPENSSGDIPEYTVRLGSPELAALIFLQEMHIEEADISSVHSQVTGTKSQYSFSYSEDWKKRWKEEQLASLEGALFEAPECSDGLQELLENVQQKNILSRTLTVTLDHAVVSEIELSTVYDQKDETYVETKRFSLCAYNQDDFCISPERL